VTNSTLLLPKPEANKVIQMRTNNSAAGILLNYRSITALRVVDTLYFIKNEGLNRLNSIYKTRIITKEKSSKLAPS
jgi:hypothetical protein